MNNRKYIRTNRQITSPEVRLIDEDAKQIGVLSISEAFEMARSTGLDLVEIAPMAKPPVVKLIEFSKFKYQKAKKAKTEKKGIKGGDTKELQLSPFIGARDYDTRVKRAKEFLSTGNKVKISIKFQGRQMQHPEFGNQLLDKFKKDIQEVGIIDTPPKMMGKRLMTSFRPVKNLKLKNNGKTE